MKEARRGTGDRVRRDDDDNEEDDEGTDRREGGGMNIVNARLEAEVLSSNVKEVNEKVEGMGACIDKVIGTTSEGISKLNLAVEKSVNSLEQRLKTVGEELIQVKANGDR